MSTGIFFVQIVQLNGSTVDVKKGVGEGGLVSYLTF